MGTGILTIHQSGYGQTWDSTWAIQDAAEPDGPVNIEDLEAWSTITLPGLVGSSGTDPANGSYDGADSPIIAILGFTRAIVPAAVTITGFVVNDGSTPDSPTGPFWSQSLALPCLAETPTAATVAPLSIALLVNRSTSVIGVKPGRLYGRAFLQDAEVYPGSRVGVTWTDASAQTAATARVNTAVEDSLLLNWAPAFGEPPYFICIPHYAKIGEENAGQVIGGSPISGYSVNKPVSRQMTRGRRRPAPTP